MSLPDLIEHTKESIVLDGPEAWKQTDYLANARRAGLPLDKAVELATTLATEVSSHRDRIKRFQTSVFQEYERRPTDRRNAPPDERLMGSWLSDLHPLQLSETFVRDRWIPVLIAQLSPVGVEPAEERITSAVPTPVPVTASLPQSAPVVRKFTAMPERVRRGQAVMLEWEVDSILTVTVDEVGEGLPPRNQAWIKPAETADYGLFDVNNNLLSTVQVEVIPRDRSGLYGVLFAVALLALIYWFIKGNKLGSRTNAEPDRTTSQPTANDVPTPSRQETKPEPTSAQTAVDVSAGSMPTETVPTTTDSKSSEEAAPESSELQTVIDPEPMVTPVTAADARVGKYEEAFGDKPYDKIEVGVDERGWRRARIKGRWGYVNENDEWVIQPEYEAVTRFRSNTATVFLNGQLININREGAQIRN